MPKQVPYRPRIAAPFEQMGGAAFAQGLAADRRADAGCAESQAMDTLDQLRIEMRTGWADPAGVGGLLCASEHMVPGP